MTQPAPSPTDETVILRPGRRYKPEIRVEQLDGQRVLIKDYGPCGAWFRLIFGRWLVCRECAAYGIAQGLPGVAQLVGRRGPYAFAVEYMDARPCTQLNGRALPDDFGEQLVRLVDGLHARHLAHGDLKKLENILVDDGGSVCVVDFSSAAYSRFLPVHVIGYPFLREDDRRAVVKAKLALTPEAVTEEERALLAQRSRVERWFRWARRWVRPAIKALGGRRDGESGDRETRNGETGDRRQETE
jgi:serine/threonine protein kinase